ncbi:MAG: hypothetical protein IT578_03870 [Verrucomicrobiae bacterium]|nr:hypothetical protein [Verrucomicrobiae bacterium]
MRWWKTRTTAGRCCEPGGRPARGVRLAWIPGSPQRGRIARDRFLLATFVAAWLVAAGWARHECLPYDVNNTDVGTYLFQAETFAAGRLWRETPEPREFFQQWQAIVRDRSFAFYPPLPALALALPLAFGGPPFSIPWLASGLALLLAFVWIRRLAGRRAAWWGTVALALSPFFVANGLSLLSHAVTLGLTFAFLIAVERAAAGSHGGAAVSGALLAAVFASRPVNALALALAWFPWVVVSSGIHGRPTAAKRRRKAFLAGLSFSAGFAAIFAPLMLYYRELSGRWTLSLFTDYWPRVRLGFGQGVGRGEPGHYFQTFGDHDFFGFLANLKYYAKSLAEWWTGNAWVSLALLGFAGVLGATRLRRRIARATSVVSNANEKSSPAASLKKFSLAFGIPRALWPLSVWVVLHVGFYASYFSRSTEATGPRFLAELMPALAFVTGWTFAAAQRALRLRVAAALLFAGLLAAQAEGVARFLRFNRLGIPARRGVELCVREEAEAPALVFLRSFWIGHPLPIFRNSPGLSEAMIFACDRGAEDRRLVERFPERNAYVLALFPERRGVRAKLVPIYRARDRRWLRAPESVDAPFFVGARFTAPLRLEGETARKLFHPRPEEIEGQ